MTEIPFVDDIITAEQVRRTAEAIADWQKPQVAKKPKAKK